VETWVVEPDLVRKPWRLRRRTGPKSGTNPSVGIISWHETWIAVSDSSKTVFRQIQPFKGRYKPDFGRKMWFLWRCTGVGMHWRFFGDKFSNGRRANSGDTGIFTRLNALYRWGCADRRTLLASEFGRVRRVSLPVTRCKAAGGVERSGCSHQVDRSIRRETVSLSSIRENSPVRAEHVRLSRISSI